MPEARVVLVLKQRQLVTELTALHFLLILRLLLVLWLLELLLREHALLLLAILLLLGTHDHGPLNLTVLPAVLDSDGLVLDMVIANLAQRLALCLVG